MEKRKHTALLVLTAIFSFACTAPSQSGIAEPRRDVLDQTNGWCAEWDRRVELLRPESRSQLESDGITLGGYDQAIHYGYYLLNKDKVDDCKKRVRFGEILRALVNGLATDEDSRDLARNPGEFINVVGMIWNAPGFSTDGTVHEKYLILEATALDDATVGEFVRGLLASEGISSELISVISERKLTSVTGTLDDGFESARRTNNRQKQSLFLIALYQLDGDMQRARAMRKLASARAIDPTGKKAMLKVAAAMDRGETIDPVDCEAVEGWL